MKTRRLVTLCALLATLTACFSIFTGCTAHRIGVGLGPPVAEAMVEQVFKPVFEPSIALAYAANEFRKARKHWPKDYEDLSSFLQQSDEKKYEVLQSVQYHRIGFSETPDGRLEINADYSFASGGTVRIEGMRVSAFETDEK